MKSERTKNLSAAPWKVEEWIHGKGAFVVRNNKGYLVAENMSEQDANRLARLPELYDKLAEATKHYCGICKEEITGNNVYCHKCGRKVKRDD